MTSDWLTKLKRFALSALLLLCLSGCLNTQRATKPPPPVSKPAAAAVLPLETIRSICLAWFNSLPTWQDTDAERTKDEIDRSYQVNDAACEKYLNGAPA